MADLVNAAPGQCRLTVDSTSQLSLQRYQGAYLPLNIGGVWEAKLIPSSAPTLANTGLTAATLYYIYVFDDSGTLTLEASTTVHATDADTGAEIKSGDASRTLVGKVFMGAGSPGTFVDSIVKRWCLNWFNRRGLDMLGVFTAARTLTVGNPYGEVNAEIRIEFLSWADEAVMVFASGLYTTAGGFTQSDVAIGLDGTGTRVANTGGLSTAAGERDYGMSAVVTVTATASHFFTMLAGNQGGGNAIAFGIDNGGGADKARTTLYGLVRG